MNEDIELELSDLDGLDLADFDASEYLGSDEAIAAYLTEALASGDAALFAAAVNNIARARGMTEIAKKSGLAREGLYKALRPGSQPRMETMTRVLQAMNMRLVAQPMPPVADAPVRETLPVATVRKSAVRKTVAAQAAAAKRTGVRQSVPARKAASKKLAGRRTVHA